MNVSSSLLEFIDNIRGFLVAHWFCHDKQAEICLLIAFCTNTESQLIKRLRELALSFFSERWNTCYCATYRIGLYNICQFIRSFSTFINVRSLEIVNRFRLNTWHTIDKGASQQSNSNLYRFSLETDIQVCFTMSPLQKEYRLTVPCMKR